MKRTTQKFVLLLTFFLVVTNVVVAQTFRPFTAGKYTASLKGDMLLIGNGILNRYTTTTSPNVPFNGTGVNDINDLFDMRYIDIDGDPTTFSSSSANLIIPTKGTANCYKIAYAALYWGGLYTQANLDNNSVSRTNLNQVKFKPPGGTYTTVTGTTPTFYDSYPNNIYGSGAPGYAYVSYADVTSLLQGLANANGTYTVADLVAGNGKRTSGGWSLYVVYEDPLATAKNITVFDGFSTVKNTETLKIPIVGFQTIPVGPVLAKFAFSALEGH